MKNSDNFLPESFFFSIGRKHHFDTIVPLNDVFGPYFYMDFEYPFYTL